MRNSPCCAKLGRGPFLTKSFLALAASSLVLIGYSVPVSANSSAAPIAASVDLAQYRGKVVYLDFWASWCAPCKLSFRFMNSLRSFYGPNDLVIVTVNMDHDRRAAEEFLRETNSTLAVAYDPQGRVAARYKVSAMPTSVLIGRDGRGRYVHRGYFDTKAAEYQQHVNALVSEHS